MTPSLGNLTLNLSPQTEVISDYYDGDPLDPSEFQSGLVVDNTNLTISGTLYNVTGFTAYSEDVADQDGNFMILKIEANPSDADIVYQVINGQSEGSQVPPDANGIAVIKVADAENEQLKVIASKNGYETLTYVYSLTGLVSSNTP